MFSAHACWLQPLVKMHKLGQVGVLSMCSRLSTQFSRHSWKRALLLVRTRTPNTKVEYLGRLSASQSYSGKIFKKNQIADLAVRTVPFRKHFTQREYLYNQPQR